MPKTAIVIPTYNEKDNIRELIERIFSNSPLNIEIIFVDDNSPDGTAEEIISFKGSYPVELIKRNSKLGLGSAYLAGFSQAVSQGYDYIMEMDADLSHAPEDIPKLISAVESGADLSIGSRKTDGGKIIGWNLWRHLMSDGAMYAARLVLDLKTKDVTAGFRCYRRAVLEKIGLDEIRSNGYAFQEEMLFRTEQAGYKVAEVPVTFADRKKGKSKLSSKDVFEFFKLMIKLR